MQDDEFRDWVQGQSRQETFWITFLQNNPKQKGTIHQAEQIIRATQLVSEPISEKEIRNEVATFLTRAGAKAPETAVLSEIQQAPSLFRRYLFSRAAAVAAVLIAAFGVAWLFLPSSTTTKLTSSLSDSAFSELVVTNNPTKQPLSIFLSDSTEVVLSPQSSLSYPSQFSDTARVVFLTGEARFSVTHRGQPFMVRTDEMVTRVLGTQFVVSAFKKEKKFTVQVLSGKVSVYRVETGMEEEIKEVKGLILTVNQAAIFEKDLHHLTKTLVAHPTVITKISPDNESRYDEVALPTILHDLERSYGIAIQYDEQSLNPCKVTATLGSESLYEKLDMLCKTVSASYQIVDGQIVISGKGCL